MKRALVVDDKDVNIYYLRTLLAAHGWDVVTAANGAEALQAAHETPPDVVVSDLLMPVMDGYTLLRKWKADETLRSIPFIVYTATYTDPEDEDLARRLGADAFILKPSEPDDFIAALKAVRRRGAATPALVERAADDSVELLREYNEVLVRKLEQRTLQLEQALRRVKQDLVARKAAEAELRETEERFRQLEDNIDDVLWISSAPTFAVDYISPAFHKVWGRLPEEMVSVETWLASVHPDDVERLTASLPDYLTREWAEMYRIIRPDGEVRWVRSRSYLVHDEAGDLRSVVGVSRDVTEYRRIFGSD